MSRRHTNLLLNTLALYYMEGTRNMRLIYLILFCYMVDGLGIEEDASTKGFHFFMKVVIDLTL